MSNISRRKNSPVIKIVTLKFVVWSVLLKKGVGLKSSYSEPDYQHRHSYFGSRWTYLLRQTWVGVKTHWGNYMPNLTVKTGEPLLAKQGGGASTYLYVSFQKNKTGKAVKVWRKGSKDFPLSSQERKYLLHAGRRINMQYTFYLRLKPKDKLHLKYEWKKLLVLKRTRNSEIRGTRTWRDY